VDPRCHIFTLAFRIQTKTFVFGILEASFSLTPRPSLEKRHIETWLAFSILKRRFVLDTKSKCHHDSEGLRPKNSHIEDDLILGLKKQTPAVKVMTVRPKKCNNGKGEDMIG
jgi:hypothetical protein